MDLTKLTLHDLSPVRKRLEVEIAPESVRDEIDRAFSVVGRQASLRGFRPGKAPRPVLERVFGEQVRREVLGRLVEASLRQAVDQHRLAVVGEPDIEAEALRVGEALRFSATLDIRPVIEVGDTEGLEAARPTEDVGDAEVEGVLNSIRESVAQLRPIEDRVVVEVGDVVAVDVTSRIEGGEPIRRQDVLLEAGAGSFPLALERQLVGARKGTRLSVRVPYPSDHSNPSLAGKAADFEVEIKDLRTKDLPPLDDDFARDHGQSDSLTDFRARIRGDLERQAEQRADARVREAIVDQLLERHPFEVPPSLVDRRCDALLASLDLRLPEGAAGEEALQRLRAEVRPRAERDVRADMLLEAIAAREGIAVEDDVVSAEIEATAVREGQVAERVRAFYARPEAREALRARLVRERALAQVLGRARIVPTDSSKDVARQK